MRVARAAPHGWEEPCISGVYGSGTVFFSHCTLGCIYCQNAALSREGTGQEVTQEQLSEIFLALQKQNVHNLNLVTPTHYAPQIVAALRTAKTHGLRLPVVYNCGGYERVQTVRALQADVDVWLPDFKYATPRLAARYSHAQDYPETALAAIGQMVRQSGPPVFDDEGLLQRGVLVRHLLLPGQLTDSLRAVTLLHERFGNDILISLMRQYTPPTTGPAARAIADFPALQRQVNTHHYEVVVDYACEIGVTNCYVQGAASACEDFLPAFDGTGIGDFAGESHCTSSPI